MDALPEPTPAPKPEPRRYFDHKIEIHQVEKLHEAVVFARQHGLMAEFAVKFVDMLSLIAGFHKEAEQAGRDVYGQVGDDGCKYSFCWWVGAVQPGQNPNSINRRDQGFIMNGGLICHMPHHSGHEAPTFAARLEDLTGAKSKDPEWCIHT